jgi:DNA-binding NarL/FixJ family response regulator
MPKMPRYNVLLVDDHAVVRHGLRAVLEEELGDVAVQEAGTAREGLECLRRDDYDALILDIGLPDRNGLDLLKSIHSEWPDLPVLILSMFDESQYGVRMIKAGAAGYVTKASAPEKFVTAVRKILAGGRYISANLAERLADNLTGHFDEEPFDVLSDREYQIFLMIASGKTVSEIADELCLSVKTVSTHRAHVMQKTNMKTNAELTHYAFFKGLVH